MSRWKERQCCERSGRSGSVEDARLQLPALFLPRGGYGVISFFNAHVVERGRQSRRVGCSRQEGVWRHKAGRGASAIDRRGYITLQWQHQLGAAVETSGKPARAGLEILNVDDRR